ncbi:F-box domain-containing protein [Entamoeba marina]
MINEPNYDVVKQRRLMLELDLFPILQTIQIHHFSPFILRYNPHRIHRIIMKDSVDADLIPQITEFHERIIEMRLFCYETVVDLSIFHNLERIILKVHLNRPCIIRFQNCTDVEFLNSIHEYNFDLIVVEFTNSNDLSTCIKIPNIFSKCLICFDTWFNGIDPNVIILKNNWLLFDQYEDIQNIINLYFPSSISIAPNFTTSYINHLTQLQSISISNNSQYILPLTITSLTHCDNCENINELYQLKELHISECSTSIIVPKEVTSLVLNSCNTNETNFQDSSCVKKLLITKSIPSFDIGSFYSLTSLVLQNVHLDNSFQQLDNLLTLELIHCTIHNDINCIIPKSLQNLKCEMNQIPTLHPLTSLVVNCDYSNNVIDITSLQSLKDITFKKCSNLTFQLPQSVEYLSLDFSYSFLKTFLLTSQNITIYLPTSLSFLLLNNSVNVEIPNIKSIPLNCFALNKSIFNVLQLNSTLKQLFINNNATISMDDLRKFPLLKNIESDSFYLRSSTIN